MNEATTHFFEEGNERLRYLVVGYIRQTLTEREEDELDQWVSASEANLHLFEDWTDEEKLEESLRFLERIDTKAALVKVREKTGVHESRKSIFNRWSYGIAASLLLAAGLYFFWPFSSKEKGDQVPPVASNSPSIVPGTDKATLTTGDGHVISLTDLSTGFSAVDQGTQYTKTSGGELSYQAGTNHPSVAMHILQIPRGGQFKVLLPDGSKVWLNAASSLTYPTAFSGNERKVYLSGEAYFEVTSDKSRPFRVGLVDSSEVEVLGTHFNIQHYPDETTQQTTLLEGAVKLKVRGREQVLQPGEQAQFSATGKLMLFRGVDTESVTAWKNGHFAFKDAPIETIMRQVARWYNAEIVYEGKISHVFTADVSRHEPVTKLLRLLELTNRVHFTITQNKIYVQP